MAYYYYYYYYRNMITKGLSLGYLYLTACPNHPAHQQVIVGPRRSHSLPDSNGTAPLRHRDYEQAVAGSSRAGCAACNTPGQGEGHQHATRRYERMLCTWTCTWVCTPEHVHRGGTSWLSTAGGRGARSGRVIYMDRGGMSDIEGS